MAEIATAPTKSLDFKKAYADCENQRGLLTWVQFCEAAGVEDSEKMRFRENPVYFFEQTFGPATKTENDKFYWNISQYWIILSLKEKQRPISMTSAVLEDLTHRQPRLL